MNKAESFGPKCVAFIETQPFLMEPSVMNIEMTIDRITRLPIAKINAAMSAERDSREPIWSCKRLCNKSGPVKRAIFNECLWHFAVRIKTAFFIGIVWIYCQMVGNVQLRARTICSLTSRYFNDITITMDEIIVYGSLEYCLQL